MALLVLRQLHYQFGAEVSSDEDLVTLYITTVSAAPWAGTT
jgi:hypothetical protein